MRMVPHKLSVVLALMSANVLGCVKPDDDESQARRRRVASCRCDSLPPHATW